MAEKTNVMRILDKAKIEYKTYDYTNSGAISGKDVAVSMGQDPSKVFKTLVTQAKSKQYYVFMIPVLKELDLKKAAKAVGEKDLNMIPQKELLSVTGYIHGGCSPIGMKKSFKTCIDVSAQSIDTIIFSAGKIGRQVETSPNSLKNFINAKYFDLIKSDD